MELPLLTLKRYANFEEKLTCGLKKDLRNLANFHRALESVKIGKGRKGMTLKFAEGRCVMAVKNDAKFEEGFICHFKTNSRNLTNFDSSTRQSKKIAL